MSEDKDVLLAYAGLLGTVVAGNAPGLGSLIGAPLPYFATLATLSLYIGSKRGLLNKDAEIIGFKQGATAPLFLSVSIFGIYVLTKLEISFETFLNAYFFLLESLSGCFCIWAPFMALGRLAGEKELAQVDLSWIVEKEGGDPLPSDFSLKPSAVLTVGISVALACLDRFIIPGGEGWCINNIEASFIVITWLELLGVGSFRTAMALLFGLLVYDCFWVFGSGEVLAWVAKVYPGIASDRLLPTNGSVMADVAMSPIISAPTKFLFPRDGSTAAFKYSLLGLGDVLIPGLLIGLLLRFDVGKMEKESGGGEYEYFKYAICAYVLGLLVSFGASLLSGKGQPALLYLVPLVSLSAIGVSLKRSEFRELLSFEWKSKK